MHRCRRREVGQVMNMINHRQATQGCKGLDVLCLKWNKLQGQTLAAALPWLPIIPGGLAFHAVGCSDLLMLVMALLVRLQ